MLQVPVLGRGEQAADQFAAYIMLRLSKDEARRTILGSSYLFQGSDATGPEISVPIQKRLRTNTRYPPNGCSVSFASPMAPTRNCLPTS